MIKMTNTIKISNYDLEDGCTIRGESLDLDSPYRGVGFEGNHYIVNINDLANHATIGRGGLEIPRAVFEVIDYNVQTMVSRAREVTDRTLVERIALEFHMKNREFSDEI